MFAFVLKILLEIVSFKCRCAHVNIKQHHRHIHAVPSAQCVEGTLKQMGITAVELSNMLNRIVTTGSSSQDDVIPEEQA